MGDSGLIYDTYPLFTNRKHSIIQTSSVNRPTIHSIRLSNYLRYLAYISSKTKGIKVNLDFGKNMFVRDIKRIANRINIDVDVLQFFKKCDHRSDSVSCYSDITTKTFRLKIQKSGGKATPRK